MGEFRILFVCVALLNSLLLFANEIDYCNCKSLQEVIVRETQEIRATDSSQHEELAQLYTSRGESFLLNAQYPEAIEDFRLANHYVGYCRNSDVAMIISFRVAFGQAVGYDNLGMSKETNEALEQLQIIAAHVGCDDCLENRPCQDSLVPSTNNLHFRNLIQLATNSQLRNKRVMWCKDGADNYNDISGPTQPPYSGWCEEVVVGVGRAMDAISCLAPNPGVRVVLIGIIEALITRGVKCCQAGGFWKACVAPIARKWREWNNNKKQSTFPTEQNLYLFTY